MDWLSRLERRFGRWRIPNLMKGLLIGQAAAWAVVMFVYWDFASVLELTRAGLAHGQIWRLVTFLFVPLYGSVFAFLLGIYLYWIIGSSLEAVWGEFRFNVYILAGVLGCIAAALLTGSCSNYWIYLSLFLAYAVLYPEQQLLLFFILPIKMKWLGWAAGVYWLVDFARASAGGRIQMTLSLAGFVLFFGPMLYSRARAWARREQWRRKNRGDWNNRPR